MREKIILVPSANGTELLRSLALNGSNTLCLRVMSSAELAETALMRNGVTVTQQYIRTVDEPSLIFSFLNEVEFFSSASCEGDSDWFTFSISTGAPHLGQN